ncbi:respiratory chain complex I subunit 1 family protein [Melioribacter sp. OK-6-Me]|uniref:respiratory chain complex I subunit 1 family protein n=1 Tax=unclassified Melioribacter TaxID=2627329 RepID=UPI003ED8A158
MIKIMLTLVAIFFSPLFVGVINKVKAIWAGRHGASVFQPYFDLLRLFRKGEVISTTTSFVFEIAPSINLAAVIFALLFTPFPYIGSVLKFNGDFVIFAYSLGLAKFFLVIAALDTGSSFEGMGANREVTFSTIVETAFFVLLGTLAFITNQTSFEQMFLMLNSSAIYTLLIKLLFVVSLFIMLLAEGSRVPIDDPNTHLELTMIHEVMILDYSGVNLAFMIFASQIKMLVIALLISNFLIPLNFSIALTLLFCLMSIFLIYLCVGLVESLIARSRISHVPQFLFLMTALALTSFAIVAFFTHGGIK